MAGYIGGKVAVSAPQQIETKHTITATASQTSIPNVGYTVGAVHVYQNGIRLVDGTDYTATNGSTVTLETGATEGDQIVIVSHGSFETSDTVSKASGGTFSSNVAVSGNVTATGSVTANSLIVPDGSIPLVDLDIDGGTDIGAALVDADLMIVDDGAGGTNRKATMDRLATYMGTKIGGGYEFISSTDISDAATYVFTAFDASKYDHYQVVLSNVVVATDGSQVFFRTSTDAGNSYDSADNSYTHQEIRSIGPNDVESASGFNNREAVHIAGVSGAMGTATGEEGGISGILTIFNPHNTSSVTTLSGTFGYANSSGVNNIISVWYQRKAAEDVTGIQLKSNSGNIASGQVNVYGLVNS